MIVPNGKRWNVGSQVLEFFFGSKFVVLGFEDFHVFGVAIDVVTEIDEQFGFFGNNRVENRLIVVLMAT